MKLAAQIIFWLSASALFYAYAGYPVLLALVSAVRPRKVRRGKFETSVTVIITAYNEERALAGKLENTLALDYPRALLEVIVASDCSTDRTDEIARAFASRGVRLHRQPDRLGKARFGTVGGAVSPPPHWLVVKSSCFPTPPVFTNRT